MKMLYTEKDDLESSRWTVLPQGAGPYIQLHERRLHPTLMDAIRSAPRIKHVRSRIVQTIGGKVVGEIDSDSILLAFARRCALSVAEEWMNEELHEVVRYLTDGRLDDVAEARRLARKLVYSWRAFRKPAFRAAVRALFVSTRGDIPVMAAKYAARFAMAADDREPVDVKALQEAAIQGMLIETQRNAEAPVDDDGSFWRFSAHPDDFAGYG